MIIVTGDSWACGEWSMSAAKTGGISHGGIAQLLREQGYSVVNLGMPGNNNYDSVRRLRWFLQNNQHLKPTQIISFKSDIARNINTPDIKRGYIDFCNATSYGYYFQLTEVMTLFDIPCVVIGGSSDTLRNPISHLDQCKNTKIAVESFTNFLLTGNPHNDKPVLSLWQEHDSVDKIDQIKSCSTQNDVQALLTDLELADERLAAYQARVDLFPDGGHPSAHGHKLLLDYLILEKYIK